MAIAGYLKHVSFDDLAPTLIDDQADILKQGKKHVGFNNKFLHVPPQFNPLYQSDSEHPKKKQDIFVQDRSGERRKSHDNEKMEMMLQFMTPHQAMKPTLSSPDVLIRSRSSSPMAYSRGNHRLPPPPKVASIKKSAKRVDEQGHITDYDVSDMDFATEKKLTKETEKNTQSNSGSREGYTQAAFANLNELEDRLDPKTKRPIAKDSKSGRKKSFAGMSDKELAELENFYESQSRSTTSPTIENFDFKEQDPFFIDKFDKKGTGPVIDPLAAIYPSRPVVDHRAISVTVEHPKYDQYVQGFNTKTGSRKPEESLAAIRHINCYISGRRYTWCSVDWYVENVARDGDHLVIVTSIPFFEREIDDSDYALSRKQFAESHGSEYGSFDDVDRDLGRVSTSSSDASKAASKAATLAQVSKGFRIKAIHDEARQKCINIMNYYASRLHGKVVKITVEMIKCDSPEFAITKAAALYRPDLQIVSTVSTNLQIRFRNGRVKLPFFVMQHYPMTTAVVPYEFIDPKLLGEENTDTVDAVDAKKVEIPRGDDRLLMIDNAILKSLKNPFASDADTTKKDEDDANSLVESVNEYFPMPPEQRRKYELFEKMGYVRCPPTRQAAYMKNSDPANNMDDRRLTPFSTGSSRNNSRRSSRIQYDDGMYKVKSLIVDSSDSDDEKEQKRHSASIRKTRSMGQPTTKTGYLSPPALSPTTSLRKTHNGVIHVTGTKTPEHASPASEGKNRKEKKGKDKKKSFGSFFKKVFK